MRAAAILGLGCSPKHLAPFQANKSIEWRMGMPADRTEVDIVLLFGGDGTIHRHLGQLVKLGLPVLVVPAGSGNDFAHSLGLQRVRDSLSAWHQFSSGSQNVGAIDLGVITPIVRATEDSSTPAQGRATYTYFSCVAGVGLDGEVARRANQMPRWLRGHGGYLLGMIPSIFSFAPQVMKILLPVETAIAGDTGWKVRSHQPTLIAALANTPLYGGGMRVAPHAKLDDGLLDICVVGAVSPLKLFSVFPTVYAGRHLGIREVEYFQAARVRVETEEALDVYADGEYVCKTPIEVSIEPTALKVVTFR
jgi:diacylglycerol kinase (ATP)